MQYAYSTTITDARPDTMSVIVILFVLALLSGPVGV